MEQRNKNVYSLESICWDIYYEKSLQKDLLALENDCEKKRLPREELAYEIWKLQYSDREEAKKKYKEYTELIYKDDKENVRENIRKRYVKKLNEMFGSLFDYNYTEIIRKKGKNYELGSMDREFIKFIIKTSYEPDGKNIMKKDYAKVGIFYRSLLFSYVHEFINNGNCTKKEEDLIGKLYERFKMSRSAERLIDALKTLNQQVEELIIDEGLCLEPYFDSMADKIQECGRQIVEDI